VVTAMSGAPNRFLAHSAPPAGERGHSAIGGRGVGYNLHIHRAEEWHDSASHPISASEWMAMVEGDPELRPDPDHEFHALWLARAGIPTGRGSPGPTAGFTPRTRTARFVAKMLQIARKLGGRVQGDHGEFYNRPVDMPSAPILRRP
jgi:hypothetical protein